MRRNPAPTRTGQHGRGAQALGPAHDSRGFRKAVQVLRVLDENTPASLLLGRPDGEKVEQQGVVRLLLLVLRSTVRPVAAPHHALRRRLGEGLCDPGRLRVVGRADLAVVIGGGQFDPGAARGRSGRGERRTRRGRGRPAAAVAPCDRTRRSRPRHHTKALPPR
jgi:hypothetical protein